MKLFEGYAGNITAGHLLFVICCLFYLAWWSIAFRPGFSAPTSAKTVLFILTAVAGLIGLSIIVQGCLEIDVKTPVATAAIIGACAALYIALLLVTNIFMHRQVTTELMLIVFWVCMELCVINKMCGAGDWSGMSAVILAVLAVIAAGISMICYLQYYNLEPMKGFYMGMVPLIIFAVYMAAVAVFEIVSARG